MKPKFIQKAVEAIGISFLTAQSLSAAQALQARVNLKIAPEVSGSSIVSGDGSAVSFAFAHGLGVTPSYVNVQPATADATDIWYYTADATNITVYYQIAPTAGSGNVKFYWQVKGSPPI